MKPELQQKLFKKYPKIFRQKDLPMTETAMCWGIDCGDGWYWLIDNLCHSIQSYCDSKNSGINIRNNIRKEWWQGWNTEQFGWKSCCHFWKRFKERNIEDLPIQVEAVQVKEKYGGLRFYIVGCHPMDNDIFGMIHLAEEMSYNICEKCGSTENVIQTDLGWIRSLCPKCMKKHKKNEG